MQKVTDFIKANPKLAAYMLGVALTLLTAATGLNFVARPAQPGEQPGIVIVYDDEGIFGPTVAQAGPGEQFSETGRRALRSAGGVLRERRADREPFFAMLRDLHANPEHLPQYEAAAEAKGFDPVTITIAVKIAVKVAITILERRAPQTPNEWDDRLLKLLKLFDANPFVLPRAGL